MMKSDQAAKSNPLPQYVGYDEIEAHLLMDRRTVQRLKRAGLFPQSVSATPGKNGAALFLLSEVLEWDRRRREGLVRSSFSMPPNLPPQEVDARLRQLAADAFMKKTGQTIEPEQFSLDPILDEASARKMLTEHQRMLIAGLAALPTQIALALVHALLPQLQPFLDTNLEGPDSYSLDFGQLRQVLDVIELGLQLKDDGLEFAARQPILERLSEFEQERALVVAAWLFPSLRKLIAESATEGDSRALSDPAAVKDLALTALDDDLWARLKLVQRAKTQLRLELGASMVDPRGCVRGTVPQHNGQHPLATVQPRVCGEQVSPAHVDPGGSGSAPRVRGTGRRYRHQSRRALAGARPRCPDGGWLFQRRP